MPKRSARAAPRAEPAAAAAEPWASARAHEVMALILVRLPVAHRVRCAAVCRAWRDAAAPAAQWTELDFRGGDVAIDTESLAALCARAGPSLRALHIDDETGLMTLSAASVLHALQASGACAGLQELTLPSTDNQFFDYDAPEPDQFMLLPAQAQALQAACPALRVAACSVLCDSDQDAQIAAAALPGPIILCFTSRWGDMVGNVDPETAVVPAHWVAPSVAGMLTIGSEEPPSHFSLSDEDVSFLASALLKAPGTALRMLDVRSALVGDPGMEALAGVLSSPGCALTSLFVNAPEMTDTGGVLVANTLASNTSLRSVRLCCNQTQLGTGTGLSLADALARNTTLQKLQLHAELDDLTMQRLSLAVCENRTLRELYLYNTYWLFGRGGTGPQRLADVLRPGARCRLEALRVFVESGGRGEVVAALCDAAAQPGAAPALLTLGVEPPDVDDGAPGEGTWLEPVCAMLRANATLRALNLPELFETDRQVTALAHALRDNSTLVQLNLCFENDKTCKNAGVVALAEALTPPCRPALSLERLELTGMRVGAAGSRALCAMLRQNTVLSQLYAPCAAAPGENDEPFAAMAPLCAALRVNRTLRMLSVGCDGKAADTVALGRVLAHNTGLVWLDCSGVCLDLGGAASLATGLRRNTRLRQLSMSVRYLSGTTLPVLAGALSRTRTLTYFSVDDITSPTGVSHPAAIALCHAARTNDHASALVLLKLCISEESHVECYAAIDGREPFETALLLSGP